MVLLSDQKAEVKASLCLFSHERSLITLKIFNRTVSIQLSLHISILLPLYKQTVVVDSTHKAVAIDSTHTIDIDAKYQDIC